MPDVASGFGGLASLPGQFADTLGQLLGGSGASPEPADPDIPDLTEPSEPDDDVADEPGQKHDEDTHEDGADQTAGEPDDLPSDDNPDDAGCVEPQPDPPVAVVPEDQPPAPPSPVATPPAAPPPDPPVAPAAPVTAPLPPGEASPCEIAADELPQAGS